MMKRYVTWYLIVAMLVLGIAPRVEAAFSPSETLTLAASIRTADIESIRVALENKLVRQRLQDLGFSNDEVASRLSQLSDEQLHSMAKKIDDLKVGKDGGAGVLIVVLLIVLIVVLVIALSGGRRGWGRR